MKPSIFSIGTLNEAANYTLDMILQTQIVEPTQECAQLRKDRMGKKFKSGKYPKKESMKKKKAPIKVKKRPFRARLNQPVVSEEWLIS